MSTAAADRSLLQAEARAGNSPSSATHGYDQAQMVVLPTAPGGAICGVAGGEGEQRLSESAAVGHDCTSVSDPAAPKVVQLGVVGPKVRSHQRIFDVGICITWRMSYLRDMLIEIHKIRLYREYRSLPLISYITFSSQIDGVPLLYNPLAAVNSSLGQARRNTASLQPAAAPGSAATSATATAASTGSPKPRPPRYTPFARPQLQRQSEATVVAATASLPQRKPSPFAMMGALQSAQVCHLWGNQPSRLILLLLLFSLLSTLTV